MCQFVSAVKKGENYFYLTKNDLKGRKFSEFKKENPGWRDDIIGHGAIEYFYPELVGNEHWECTDFSTPNNFPACIVEDIKKGNFEGIGICPEILNKRGLTKYKKIVDPAWAEREKIRASARAEYDKIVDSAWDEYDKIVDSAQNKRDKIVVSAQGECEKKRASAWGEYEKIIASAQGEYSKIIESAFWEIAVQKQYRKKEWK